MDGDEVCRVCLQQDGDLINIFDSMQDPEMSIPDMIAQWCGYQVERGDLLPETICPTCLEDARATIGIIQNIQKKEISRISAKEDWLYGQHTVKVESNIAQEYQVKNEPVDDDIFTEAAFKGMDSSLFEEDVCKIEDMETDQSNSLKSMLSASDLDNIPKLRDPPSRGKRRYKCSLCPKSFADASQFSQHIVTHSGDKADGQKSDFSESDFSAAEFEEDDYYPDSETELPPKKSKDKQPQKSLTPKKTHLKQHNPSHLHDQLDKSQCKPTLYMPYKCNYCPQTFKDKDSYRLHSKTHGKQYRCSDCPKTFAKAKHLKQHILSHSEDQSDKHNSNPSDPPNRVFKCPKCPKTFPYASSCSRHLMSHSETRPYKCPQCPNSYARPYALRAHFSSHSGERPFKCDQCPNTYRKAHHLRHHLLTHSNEKPFKCSQCSKAYAGKSDLNRHLRTHAKVKAHKCDDCSKTFSRVETLRVHMRTHTGEKPFKCAHCSKSFSVRTNMYKHQGQCKLEKTKRD
nr:zinc finger protein 883-like [Drosophila takahashii]